MICPNVAKLGLARRYFEKYDSQIFKANEYPCEKIDIDSFMKFCTKGKDSSAGLDHWAPADFKMFSRSAFELLVILLNHIEAGADWPRQLDTAKAAFLASSRVTSACGHLSTAFAMSMPRYSTEMITSRCPVLGVNL